MMLKVKSRIMPHIALMLMVFMACVSAKEMNKGRMTSGLFGPAPPVPSPPSTGNIFQGPAYAQDDNNKNSIFSPTKSSSGSRPSTVFQRRPPTPPPSSFPTRSGEPTISSLPTTSSAPTISNHPTYLSFALDKKSHRKSGPQMGGDKYPKAWPRHMQSKNGGVSRSSPKVIFIPAPSKDATSMMKGKTQKSKSWKKKMMKPANGKSFSYTKSPNRQSSVKGPKPGQTKSQTKSSTKNAIVEPLGYKKRRWEKSSMSSKKSFKQYPPMRSKGTGKQKKIIYVIKKKIFKKNTAPISTPTSTNAPTISVPKLSMSPVTWPPAPSPATGMPVVPTPPMAAPTQPPIQPPVAPEASTRAPTQIPTLVPTNGPTSAPSATPSTSPSGEACGSIVRWWLVDANANVRLTTLEDDQVLFLSRLENEYNTFSFSIEVETDPPVVGSVAFVDNFGVGVPLDNTAPYLLTGDDNGDYFALVFEPGDWTVTAQPYCEQDALGGAGPASAIRFLLLA